MFTLDYTNSSMTILGKSKLPKEIIKYARRHIVHICKNCYGQTVIFFEDDSFDSVAKALRCKQ